MKEPKPKSFSGYFMPINLRPILLLIGAIAFGLGISLPLMKFQKLWFFEETPSLLGVVSGLWSGGDIFLSLIVALFSLIFPVVKMATTYQAVLGGRTAVGWASVLSKWSMMDVLLVAIVVFAAKTSGLAEAIAQPGVWFYALSTICIAAAGFTKRLQP